MSKYNSILFEVVRLDRRTPQSKEIIVYATTFEVQDSIVIPYNSIVDVFRFLYGCDVVLRFRLTSIEYHNK